MEQNGLRLATGFAVGLLMTGIPYWRLPYNDNVFDDPAVLLGFVGLGLVTAVLASNRSARLASLFWAMLAAFPAAVMIRVIVETAQDPTDHNLWPFELIFAAFFSLIAVVPGLIAGALVRRIRA